MKQIKAYIHNNRIADVIRTLREYGQCGSCHNLSVTAVKSLLKAVDPGEQHYSLELAEAVIEESRLELVCGDGQVEEVARIIELAARTGQREAGWIFVSDIITAIPIRGSHD